MQIFARHYALASANYNLAITSDEDADSRLLPRLINGGLSVGRCQPTALHLAVQFRESVRVRVKAVHVN